MKVIKVECCKDCPWSRWLRKRSGADLWQCALPGEQGEEWITIDDPHTIPDWCTLPDGMTAETISASSTDIASQWSDKPLLDQIFEEYSGAWKRLAWQEGKTTTPQEWQSAEDMELCRRMQPVQARVALLDEIMEKYAGAWKELEDK